MKRTYLLFALPLLITACKPKSSDNVSSPKTDSVTYPYTIKDPDQWQMDTSKTNTLVVLNLLKAVEKFDTAGMRKYLADSVELNFDYDKYKGPVKGILTIMKNIGDTTKNNTIKMYDWEAVTSKTHSNVQWVTTWYRQTWTNMKGKTDSIDYVDDNMVKNGKVVRVDEYAKHFKK